jgi:preprotein translocase subunit SecG
MVKFLEPLHIGISLLLIALILLQQRGTGLAVIFGGAGGFYGTRRGIEKTIFILTIIVATLFVLSSILSLIL